MQFSNSQLKSYLLGNLDAQSGEEIGVRIIADETMEEKLLIAENDLIEDFLEKNLSPVEEKLFYDNFLVCEDRKKQLDEINFFKKYSKKNYQTETPKNQTKSADNFWDKIKKLFIFNFRLAVPVFAVLIIIIGIGIYFLNNSAELTPLETEFAQLNSKVLEKTGDFTEYSNVSLISGTLRSSDTMKKVKAENLSDKTLFRLALPFTISETESLNAELVRANKVVFRQPEIHVFQNGSGQEFRLLLPKSVLSKGQYQLKIVDVKKDDAPIIYNFAVE